MVSPISTYNRPYFYNDQREEAASEEVLSSQTELKGEPMILNHLEKTSPTREEDDEIHFSGRLKGGWGGDFSYAVLTQKKRAEENRGPRDHSPPSNACCVIL